MDAAFEAVCVAIEFLQIRLSTEHTDFDNKSNVTAEQMVNYLCHQCEASLQFLQLLCQQKLFREQLLSNKVFRQDLFNVLSLKQTSIQELSSTSTL